LGDASGETRPPGGGDQDDGGGQDDEGGQDDGGGRNDEAGPDAVRSALNRARAAARERGALPGALPASNRRRRRPRDDGSRSGAGPDARDPQTVGAALDRLVAERGWQEAVAVGGVIGRWDAVVGAEIAAHCRPETFEDGVLTVRADSTAWATQVRLLSSGLLRRLAEEVGEGTVTKVVVRGPAGPSWRRGPRVAPGGQGPRDTYG
jgi:predicted nucleic acid-binding Zn ribbon protein